MATKPVLYGWHLSYYTGKVLCFLQRKGIDHTFQPVDLFTLMWRIPRRTGETVMPVLVMPDGVWLQDSSVIIDALEARHPDRSIHPSSPVQRFVSDLFEAWGDEWWVPVAMHTRWSHPENYALFESDAGSALLPGVPAWCQRLAASRVAGLLRGYLHGAGVRPDNAQALDAWTDHMLDLLDQHFQAHPYLLGSRPCLGDFGLVGTMYGHLNRDPWPARHLVAPRPHLKAWVERMAAPLAEDDALGDWVPDDHIPDTLLPVLEVIFAEFVPLLQGIADRVAACDPQRLRQGVLPRALGDVTVHTRWGRISRAAMPYSLWMAQRVNQGLQALPTDQGTTVRHWLRDHGGQGWLDLTLPPLTRRGLRVALTDPARALAPTPT